MKNLFFIIFSFLLFSTPFPVHADDYLEGLHAYNQDDFHTAFKIFKPLAEQGNPQAQNKLGRMYSQGKGESQKTIKKRFDCTGFQRPREILPRKTIWDGCITKARESHRTIRKRFGCIGWRPNRVMPMLKIILGECTAREGESHRTIRKRFGCTSWRPTREMPVLNITLGECMGKGKGVPVDFVQAQMWFHLAAEQGHKNAVLNRDKVEKRLMADQSAKARKLAKEWIKNYQEN